MAISDFGAIIRPEVRDLHRRLVDAGVGVVEYDDTEVVSVKLPIPTGR